MSTDLTLFDNMQLPTWARATIATNAEFTSGVTVGFPFLSIEGKSWTVVRDGVRKMVLRQDGDPAASVEMVLVRANPGLSKVYYKGTFEKGSKEKPDCSSADGIKPDQGVKAPQAKSCAICPNNAWGTGQGGKGKACQDSRRLAVCSINDLTDPMLLRVPPASLKPLAEFAKWADGRQLKLHTIVVKVSFDPESATPKLQFAPLRLVTQEQFQAVETLRDGDLVAQIIGLQRANERAIDSEFEEPVPPAVEVTKEELAAVVPEAVKPRKAPPLRAVKEEPAAPETTDIEIKADTLEGLDDLIDDFDDA